MKAYKDLYHSEIVVETPDGELTGIVAATERGTGDDRYCLNLSVLLKTKPPLRSQCYVIFDGKKWGAVFSHTDCAEKIYKSTLETIVPDDSFWE